MAASLTGARRVCTVCCQQVAQYTCPRCHKAYCSSNCYKKHGQHCTESFYREQATSQMRVNMADKEQQMAMLEILQRLHEQRQRDDEEEDSIFGSDDSSGGEEEEEESKAAAIFRNKPALKQLAKRAANQGDNFVLAPSDITPEIVAELEQLSLQGQLSNLVTPWRPWWTTPAAAELQLGPTGQRGIAVVIDHVQEVATSSAQEEQTAEGDHSCEMPTLPEPPTEPLPSLSTLAGCKFKASPLLHWQLLQLLVAYCAIMRMYNGEPDDLDSGEAADQLLQLAPPLSQLLVTPARHKQGIRSHHQHDQYHQQEQQQQDVQLSEEQKGQLTPPESLRSACMQLTASGAELGYITAGPPGQRSIMQIAMLDALTLLQLGRSATLLALTDSRRIVRDCVQLIKQVKMRRQQPMEQSTLSRAAATATGGKQCRQESKHWMQHLQLAAHKLLFFSVWCNEQPPTLFEGMAAQLQAELQEQLDVSSTAAFNQSTHCTPHVLATRQVRSQAAEKTEATLLHPTVVALQHAHFVHAQQLQHQHQPERGPGVAAQQHSVETNEQGAQCLKPVSAAASHFPHSGQVEQLGPISSSAHSSQNSGVVKGAQSGDHHKIIAVDGEGQIVSSLYDLD